MSVCGVLLAAGSGRRIGGPKALVSDARGPWLVRSVAALADGGCDEVVVVLGAAAEDGTRLLHAHDVECRVVVASDHLEGMSASLAAGLTAVPSRHDAALVMLVDLPDVDVPVLRRVSALSSPDTLARAAYDGRPGHPVLLGQSHWAGVLGASRGDVGARDYLAGRAVTLVECGDLATGRDVDTPRDLGRARSEE